MQKWTRKAAAVIAVICLAFGTAGVAMHKWDEMRQEKAHEELTAQVVGMSEAGTTGETMPEKKVPEVENEIDETNAIKETEYVSAIDFAVLDSQNPDVVAWIQIPGTQINYPVVQGKDNDYYLHRDLNGQKSTAGTIFLDYADRADFSSMHNVLYGHHMKNGSMFKDISRYKDQGYFDQHSEIILYTPEREIHLKALAAVCTSPDAIRRKTEFASGEEFASYIQQMTAGASASAPIEGTIVRLYSFVTCSYEFNNARTIQIKDMAAGIKERLDKKMPGQQLQQCAKQYVVNWVTLEKYKIPEERIPEEYIIMYKPFSKKYSTLILTIKIVVGILLLLFVSYLIYIYGREKKRKQDALRNLKYEHELLSLAMESGNTYAWRFDGEKAIFDPQFYELIHYDSPQMNIDDMVKFIHPDERERFLHQVANLSDHPKRTAQYRCKFTGEYQWWEFRYKQICHNDNIHIITGLLQNIQEVKDKEEELIQARKVAERAELKQSFLDNMSHEIRTPLNAITGFSNLLTTEKDLSEEEKQEFISIINDNTDLLLKLVNDVLELSRIESGNMSFNYREESVRSLLNSIYNTHQLTISSSLKFIKEFPEGDVFVHIDNMRMTQVITNFLNNAKKFTKSGHIKLGYHHQPASHEVHIFVEDTGAGIPKEELQIIFDRFYKHNEFAQGVGLGLSICKVIVEKMQGRIEVTSEINKGSRFTVVLPCL